MLSERLKALRDETFLRQEDVAKLLNISRQAYANWETGRREPNIESLIKLAKFHKVSLDYLCGLTDVRTSYLQDDKLSEYINTVVKALEQYEGKDQE